MGVGLQYVGETVIDQGVGGAGVTLDGKDTGVGVVDRSHLGDVPVEDALDQEGT